MSSLVFSRPLGDDLSPFGVSYKRAVDTSWIGPAITATDNLWNRIDSHWQANRQMHFEHDEAQLAYERQQELMRQQYDLSYQQWKKSFDEQNAYNSPANQKKLLREAGFNPYVYQHGNDIGVAQSSAALPQGGSAPSVPRASAPGYVPAQINDVGSLIMQGSALKNDRMRSFAQLVAAYPKILEAFDGDTAQAANVVKNLAGVSGLKGDKLYNNIINQYNEQKAKAESAEVQAFLAQKYGDRQAANMIASSEASINESFARVRKMASDANVNDATIDKLASDIIVNVANAWKLKKEGEKFVAEATTVNKLRQYLVSQARSKANMMSLQSLLSGSEPDTDLNDFFTSGEFMQGIKETKEIDQANSSSLLIRAMDKVFGEYIKVSSGGSTTNFNYSNSNEFRY